MAERPPELAGSLPSSFDNDQEFYNEKPLQKLFRKIKEEPLIPLGMGLTTFAFISAYRAIRRGDSHQANRMFRARVAAQGFTVVAMVAGSMYYSKDRQKTKELRKLNDEHDAEVKRQKWIRELEARDEEDQALRARLQKRMEEKAKGEQAAATTNGGILGRMGLWSQEDKSAAAEKKSAEPVEEEKKAKKNPKSSLGAIGEVMNTKKKEDESGK